MFNFYLPQADVVDRKDLNTPRKREIETAVASPNQQQIVPSVNRAGRDVYYPPGHEMMLTKREEMHAGSQAGVSVIFHNFLCIYVTDIIFNLFRDVGLKARACMNMNRVINRRVKLKQVVPWSPYACHSVVLCPVQLCKILLLNGNGKLKYKPIILLKLSHES